MCVFLNDFSAQLNGISGKAACLFYGFVRARASLTGVPKFLVPVDGENHQQVAQNIHHDGEDEEAAERCGDPRRPVERVLSSGGAVHPTPVQKHREPLDIWHFSLDIWLAACAPIQMPAFSRGMKTECPPARVSPWWTGSMRVCA